MMLRESNLETLRCTKCQLYLSCAPVTINMHGDSFCGRCNPSESIDLTTIRNKPYESIASVVRFPCRYQEQGCTFLLKWNLTKEHEENCEFRMHDCPVSVYGSCEWRGRKSEFVEHCKEYHENCFTAMHPLVLDHDLGSDSQRNILMLVFGLLFLVQIKVCTATRKIWHCVRYIGNRKYGVQFYGMLQVVRNSRTFSDLIPVVGMNEHWNLVQDQAIECNMDGLKTVLKGLDNISFSITLNKKIVWELLDEVKCYVCGRYTKPPILRSRKLDSVICGNCAEEYIEEEPDFCQKGLQLLYPCRHRSLGCAEFDSIKNIWKHEIFNCKYFTCNICGKISSDRLKQHYERYHCSLLFAPEQLLKIETVREVRWAVIKYGELLFICRYVFCNPNSEFYVCTNIPMDQVDNYSCDLKVIDFISKRAFVKPMQLKKDHAFDWTVTIEPKDLQNIRSGPQFNFQLQLYRNANSDP